MRQRARASVDACDDAQRPAGGHPHVSRLNRDHDRAWQEAQARHLQHVRRKRSRENERRQAARPRQARPERTARLNARGSTTSEASSARRRAIARPMTSGANPSARSASADDRDRPPSRSCRRAPGTALRRSARRAGRPGCRRCGQISETALQVPPEPRRCASSSSETPSGASHRSAMVAATTTAATTRNTRAPHLQPHERRPPPANAVQMLLQLGPGVLATAPDFRSTFSPSDHLHSYVLRFYDPFAPTNASAIRAPSISISP